MGIRRCLVVARTDDAGKDPTAVHSRLDSLVSFYRPLGSPRLTRQDVAGVQAMVGVIDFDGEVPDLSAPLTFGAELPLALRGAGDLLDAGDGALRTILGPSATVVIGEREVRIVTACGPPTMLYRAKAPGVEVWSTHAVAAAYVAGGGAELNRAVLPEFVAARFVGGNETLIREVEAVDSATLVRLVGAGVSERSYWPRPDRWRLLDPAEAHSRAEEALLASLASRLEPYGRVHLGLTAGLDSRVIAVALNDLGIEFDSFTFGDADWPDVGEARALATMLGVSHERAGFEWTDDDTALRTARAAARSNEGAIQLGIGRIAWPPGISAWLTGGAGETGRTFYYRQRASRTEDPNRDALVAALASSLLGQVPGAREEARTAIAQAAERWIDDARATARVDGWRTLDVVYAEQRVRRWLRGMLTDAAGVAIPGFAAPQVQAALVSLPLAERASDGFHRRFLADREAALLPAPASRTRPGALLLGRLRDRLRVRPALPELQRQWAEHPAFRAWVADEVLASPVLGAALGEGWCRETRRGFLAGAGQATHNALLAAGPIALAEELRALGSA